VFAEFQKSAAFGFRGLCFGFGIQFGSKEANCRGGIASREMAFDGIERCGIFEISYKLLVLIGIHEEDLKGHTNE
jgi:hypothetical protein